MRRRLNQLLMFAIAACIGCILSYFIDPHHRALSGQNDFTAFYLGGKLAGAADLYAPAVQYAEQKRMFGSVMESVLVIRPPFYGWILKPLSLLPYRTAYALFQSFSLAAIVWFLWRSAPHYPEILLLAPMFPPLLATLLTGQDIAILMAVAMSSLLVARKGRDFAAGLILSLCAIKLHLFIFIPLAALLNRRFRIVLGGICGGVALALLSLVGNGTQVVANYMAVLRNPLVHPGVEIMPNIRGLVSTFHGGLGVEIAIALVVAAGTAWLMWKARDYETAVAYALIGGLLVNVHCYMQDCLLAMLAFLLLIEKGQPKPVIAVLTIAMTPIPYVMLQQGAPYSAAVPLLFAGVLVAAAVSRRAPAAPPQRLPRAPVSSPAH